MDPISLIIFATCIAPRACIFESDIPAWDSNEPLGARSVANRSKLLEWDLPGTLDAPDIKTRKWYRITINGSALTNSHVNAIRYESRLLKPQFARMANERIVYEEQDVVTRIWETRFRRYSVSLRFVRGGWKIAGFRNTFLCDESKMKKR